MGRMSRVGSDAMKDAGLSKLLSTYSNNLRHSTEPVNPLEPLLKGNVHPFNQPCFFFNEARAALIAAGHPYIGNAEFAKLLSSLGYMSTHGQQSTGKRKKSRSVWTYYRSDIATAQPSERYKLINGWIEKTHKHK